jgi:hypothetical protein
MILCVPLQRFCLCRLPLSFGSQFDYVCFSWRFRFAHPPSARTVRVPFHQVLRGLLTPLVLLVLKLLMTDSACSVRALAEPELSRHFITLIWFGNFCRHSVFGRLGYRSNDALRARALV